MAWHSHVDISDGEVEPALVVAASGDGVELPACPPEGGRVVGDDGAAPAPVGRLEVAGHVTGESEAAAQRDGLPGVSRGPGVWPIVALQVSCLGYSNMKRTALPTKNTRYNSSVHLVQPFNTFRHDK